MEMRLSVIVRLREDEQGWKVNNENEHSEAKEEKRMMVMMSDVMVMMMMANRLICSVTVLWYGANLAGVLKNSPSSLLGDLSSDRKGF
jgi:hypothetical protein